MSTTRSSPVRLPAGVRDFLPRAASRRRALAERLMKEFEAWGFERLITPLFERADVLERGLGADARAGAIRFIDPSTGDVVALRPDITPQVARVAATRLGAIRGPFRLCYEGTVTRRVDGARGQREILQAGVELIDAGSPEGDAEILAVAAAALETTGVGERRLDVGDVALARCVLDAAEKSEVKAVLLERLAKKDRPGVAEAAVALPGRMRRICEALPTLYGTPRTVLVRARELPLPAAARRSLERLEQVLDLVGEVVERDVHRSITVDLGDVRGFDYYTGMRFAGYLAGAGDAVLRGGRYDELVGRYGRAARATGFAVDIEAIAEAQVATDVAGPPSASGVLIVAAPPQHRQAARVAAALRRAGCRAAVDLARRRSLTAALDYAAAVGFVSVLFVREDGGRTVRVAGGDRNELSRAALRRAARGDVAALIELLFGRTP